TFLTDQQPIFRFPFHCLADLRPKPPFWLAAALDLQASAGIPPRVWPIRRLKGCHNGEEVKRANRASHHPIFPRKPRAVGGGESLLSDASRGYGPLPRALLSGRGAAARIGQRAERSR